MDLLRAGPTMSLSFAVHGVALIATYSVYGVLQEKIVKTSYGPNAERFESTSLLILCNRIFAMAVAVLILAFKHRRSTPDLRSSLQPTSPLRHFALVAGYNFLSSCCQYQALAFVSFTTASLAKTLKMLPVILVGAVIHKRRTSFREWTSAAVIAAGCVTYFSSSSTGGVPLEDEREAYFEAVLGSLYLLGYMFFDGLTSTSQEKYFGLSASSTDPFGPDSMILQQMLFVNAFTCLYSLGGLVVDYTAGTLSPSFRLLISTSALQRDVFLLSFAAAIGLVILLNTIASFGALSSALLMTIRQFFGIVLNAGIYRHFLSVGLQGWCGVGWVASGVWIKMSASADEELISPTTSVTTPADEKALLADEADSPSSSHSSSPNSSPLPTHHHFSSIPSSSSDPKFQQLASPVWYLKNYLLPITFPLLLSCVLLVACPELSLRISQPESNTSEVQYLSHGENGQEVAVEGGQWEKELVDATWPDCNTSECDVDANFLVKTHYPERTREHDHGYLNLKMFDQAVHLVRNPVDALFSGWHLGHVPKTNNGQLDHAGRLELDHGLGATPAERADVINRARIYLNHYEFWGGVPVPTHLVRYEDLVDSRLPTLMAVVTFLLPPEDLPPLSQIACALELDESKEAYKSRKAPEFAAWDSWDPELRTEVITMLRTPCFGLGAQTLLLVQQVLNRTATQSWEIGTHAEALLEYLYPALSPFASGSIPPPSTPIAYEVLSIAARIVSTKSNGTLPLMADGSAGDPASIGAAVVLANWTSAGLGYNVTKAGFASAATDQVRFLLTDTPRSPLGAISHRVEEVALWADFVFLTQNDTVVQAAYEQCKLYRDALHTSNGLWEHIVNGSVPDPGLWATGNAWAAAGILRVHGTISHSSYANRYASQLADLASWSAEIVNAAFALQQSNGLFPNYFNSNTSTFSDASSTALLTASYYRLALLANSSSSVLSPSTLPTLSKAEKSRGAVYTAVSTSTGILSPVVDPLKYSMQGTESPEGQAFVLLMESAWRDCPKVGYAGKLVSVIDPRHSGAGWAPGKATTGQRNDTSWDTVVMSTEPEYLWNLYITQNKGISGLYKFASSTNAKECVLGDYQRTTPGLVNFDCYDNTASWFVECKVCDEGGSAQECSFLSFGDGQCPTLVGDKVLHEDCSNDGPFGGTSDNTTQAQQPPQAQYWNIVL
ncbi:hypothetical protein RQP46_007040 [Phenoliferia psychrophenolica]